MRITEKNERLILSCCTGLVVVIFIFSQFFSRANYLIYDYSIKIFSNHHSQNIIIVAVDQYSLEHLGSWPWSRAKINQIIENIKKLQPAAIGVDFILDQPSNDEDDEKLAQTLDAENIVLPVILENYYSRGQILEILPYYKFLTGDAKIGHVVREIDSDGILRRVYLKAGLSDDVWPSMGLELAQTAKNVQLEHLSTLTYFNEDKNLFAWQQNHMALIPFTKQNITFPMASAYDVYQGKPFDFSNAIVIFGSVALGLGDMLVTPVSGLHKPMSGVEVIANEVNAILNNNLLIPSPLYMQLFFGFFFIFMMSNAYAKFNPRIAIISMVFSILFLLVFFITNLVVFKVYWPVVEMMVGTILVYLISSWMRLSQVVKITNDQLLNIVGYNDNTIDENYKFFKPKNDHNSGLPFFNFLLEQTNIGSLQKTKINEQVFETLSNKSIDKKTKRKKLLQQFSSNPVFEKHDVQLILDIIMPEENNDIDNDLSREDLTHDGFINKFKIIQDYKNRAYLFQDFIQQGFDHIDTGFIIANLKGSILFYNNRINHLFYPNLIIQNSKLHDIFQNIVLPNGFAWIEILQDAALGKRIEIECSINKRSVLILLNCFDDFLQNQSYYVLNITDITKIKISEYKKEQMSSFLAHDVRSPMASIVSACQLAELEDKDLIKEHRKYFQEIEENARKAISYTNDLINLYYLDSLTEINKSYYSVIDVINEAIDSISATAKQMQISIILNKPSEDILIFMHKDMLERSIINILNNAIKYSESNTEIKINVSVEDEYANLSFIDQGQGISEQDTKRIFGYYQRKSSDKISSEKGMGLGLALVKDVIEKHQGKIHIESTVGEGTKISIYFPLHDKVFVESDDE